MPGNIYFWQGQRTQKPRHAVRRDTAEGMDDDALSDLSNPDDREAAPKSQKGQTGKETADDSDDDF